jgi:hypothetical protein
LLTTVYARARAIHVILDNFKMALPL